MPSQNSEDSDTRYEPHPDHHDTDRVKGREPHSEVENLGVGASNKAVGITLTIGVGLMLLVLILPYLGGG